MLPERDLHGAIKARVKGEEILKGQCVYIYVCVWGERGKLTPPG